MCECGCGSFSPDFQFPAPGGKVYLLSLRPPCAECDTSMGIIVELVDPTKEPHDVIAKDVPPLPFQKMFTWKECAIPMVAPQPLREQLVGEVNSTEELDDADVANALADAMRRTRNRWDEVRTAAATPAKQKKKR